MEAVIVFLASPAGLPWKDLDWPRKGPSQLLVEIYTSHCLSALSKENQRMFFLSNLEMRLQGSLNGFLVGFDFSSPTLNPGRSYFSKG